MKNNINPINILLVLSIFLFVMTAFFVPPTTDVHAYDAYVTQINLYFLFITITGIGSILLDNIRKSKEESNEK